MSPHDRDADLARLLGEAVDDVEPTDRLGEIRARTATPTAGRRWWYAGGAVLVAAAAVTAVAVLGTGTTPTTAPDPAGPPPSSVPSDVPASPAPGDGAVVAVYYVGETPMGDRLYREFRAVAASGDTARQAVELALGSPEDPDYSSPWAGTGAVPGLVTSTGDLLTVDVLADSSLRSAPETMTAARASLAVEQLVRTAQAALQSDAPVQLLLDGQRTDQLLGVPVAEPLAPGADLDVLALVSISDPVEGQEVAGTFTARGRASSFEATVPWEVRDDSGAVVVDGFATAEGWLDRLHPWEAEVDISGLAPGRYTFVAMTSDPSDGESGGPFTDTRTIVVP